MSQRHSSLAIRGEIVGDVVEGDHDSTFYSVWPKLRALDGRSFLTLVELRRTVEWALRPLRAT